MSIKMTISFCNNEMWELDATQYAFDLARRKADKDYACGRIKDPVFEYIDKIGEHVKALCDTEELRDYILENYKWKDLQEHANLVFSAFFDYDDLLATAEWSYPRLDPVDRSE